MVRYVKQYDGTSCGPVALINTLKWLGYDVSYKFLHVAKHICKCKRGGTADDDLEKALKYFKIKYKLKIKPTLKDLDKHIDSGGAAIISYFNVYAMPRFRKNSGHFAFCIERTSKTYLMVNDRTNSTTNRRRRDTMQAMLSNEVGGEQSKAWFILK